ncbi:MAG: HD domain-containing protein [Planctomycetota bacterium]|nr:HD domain-containing protein [Planctomycetota bacterium]
MTAPQANTLSERFEDALVYATQQHAGQTVKTTGAPYILHPMQVAGIALEYGADEEQAIAALLHDVLEDTTTTYEEIEARFGERVAVIVRDCSDTEDHQEKGPWQERKEAYLERLAKKDADTALVSCADKLHNSRRIVADLRACEDDAAKTAFWNHFRGKCDGSLWYYRALLQTLGGLGVPAGLLGELAHAVEQMEALA